MRFKNITFLSMRPAACTALVMVLLSSCAKSSQETIPVLTNNVNNTDALEISSLNCSEASVERVLTNLQSADSLDDLDFIITCGDVIVPVLLEGLKSDDSNTQLTSTYLLGELGSDESGLSSALIEAIQDENADVRFAAIKALAKTEEINSLEVVQPLLETLEDRDDGVRVAAVLALLERDSINPEIVDSLFEALGGNDHFKRTIERSSYDVGSIKRAIFIDGLDDGNWSMRRSAVNQLTEFAQKDFTVIDSFPQNTRFPSGVARGHIDKVFRQLGAPLLIDAVANTEVRGSALEALAKVDRQKAIPILIESTKDPDPYVRRLAIESLGNMGVEQAVPTLIDALKDSDTSAVAADALGEIKAKDSIPELIEILRTGEYQNARAAALALGKMDAYLDPRQAEPIILQMLQSKPEHWSAAAIAAGKFQLSRAIPYLIELMSDDRGGDRAAIALGEIGTEEAVDSLVLALESENSIVRKNAIIAFSHFEENSEESSYMTQVRKEEVATLSQFLPKAADEWRDAFGGGSIRTSIAKALALVEIDIVAPVLISDIPEDEGIPIFLEFLLNMTADKEVRETYLDFTRSISASHDDEIRDFSLQYMNNVSSEGILTLVDSISTSDGLTATALSYIDSDEARSALTEYFNSQKEGYLNSRTIEAIGDIEAKSAVPLLLRLIEERQDDQEEGSNEYSVVFQAIIALGKIGAEEAVSTIVRELENDSWDVRFEVVQALGNIRSPEAIPSLIKMLEDEQFYVSYAAAEALSKFGLVAVPSLMEIVQQGPDDSPVQQIVLRDKYTHLRRSALYVIGRIARLDEIDEDTELVLESIVQDGDEKEEIRMMSAVALESAGRDMSTFFDSNNLESLLEMSCPEPDKNIHVYAGMCLQDDQFSGGDGLYEIYLSLKNLFQRANEE